MSAERTVAKNAAWLVLQPLVMNVLSLVATGYLARRLGASEFGRFNLAYAFVAMFAPLTNMGLRSLTVRHVAQNHESAGDYLGKVLVLRLLLAVVCCSGIIVAAPYLIGGSREIQAVIVVAALGTIFTTAGAVLTDGFQAFEKMRPASLANFSGGLLLTIVSVAVVYYGGGIREMAMAYALGPLCSLTLLLLWSWRQPFRPRPRWSPPAFRQLLTQARPFLGINILDVVSTRVDVLVLARVMGDVTLGCYTAAMSLVDRTMVLADGAGTALLPAVAHLRARNPAAAISLLRKSALWLLIVSLPLAIMTSALAHTAVGLIFGAQYAAAAPILAIAIWRVPAMCMATLEGQSLFAVDQQSLVFRTGVVSTVTSIALIYPLVHLFGPMGGALALTTRPVVSFLLRLPAMNRHFPHFWPWSQLVRLAAALALMTLTLGLSPASGHGIQSLAIVPVAGVVYVLSLGVLRVVPLLPLVYTLCRRMGKSSPTMAWVAEAVGAND